jgi:hypothetical protein
VDGTGLLVAPSSQLPKRTKDNFLCDEACKQHPREKPSAGLLAIESWALITRGKRLI